MTMTATLTELRALTGLAMFETFDVLVCTVDDIGFPVASDCAVLGVVGVEDGGFTEEVMDAELELTFVEVE